MNISMPGTAQLPAHPFLEESMKKLYRFYTLCLLLLLCVSLFCVQAFAVEDMWTAANRIIPRSQRRSAHILPVESQRSQMGTTLQAVIEPYLPCLPKKRLASETLSLSQSMLFDFFKPNALR